MQHKKKSTAAWNLDDVAICTSTTKTFKQTFSSHIGAFIWWYVNCSACGLHIARLEKEKHNQKLRHLPKKIILGYYGIVINFLLFIFWHKFIHGNCLLTGSNFSMKILLMFWFWNLLCYLPNNFYALFCSVIQLVFSCSAIVWYPDIFVSVLVFCQCSTGPPVFCVPMFRVLVFLVLQYTRQNGVRKLKINESQDI